MDPDLEHFLTLVAKIKSPELYGLEKVVEAANETLATARERQQAPPVPELKPRRFFGKKENKNGN